MSNHHTVYGDLVSEECITYLDGIVLPAKYGIRVYVIPEDEPVDVAFGSDEEDAEYIKRFETGELYNCQITVVADHEKLGSWADGTDHLGACHVRTSHLEADVLNIVAYHGMVREAIRDVCQKITTVRTEIDRIGQNY